MSYINEEIKKHEMNINSLNNQLNQIVDNNEKNIILEKIKLEQNFLISLLKIQNSNCITEEKEKDNINKNIKKKVNKSSVNLVIEHKKNHSCLVKTKLNKRNFEILRNIELICFIAPKYIKDYSNFKNQI